MIRRAALVVAAVIATMSWSVAHADAAGTWTVVHSPNGIGPAEAGLSDVSCRTATSCVAVGGVEGPGLGMNSTLVETFDGTHWSRQPSPNAAGAPQSGLSSVSCASATWCVAVGTSQGPDGQSKRLAERWNGTSWSIMNTPVPAGAPYDDFVAVTCRTAADCTIVGDTGGPSLIEHWNGSSWSITSTASVPGGGALYGVSCGGPSACKAVGASETGSVVDSWNGSSWSFDSSPSPGALTSVYCTAATACVAVGHTDTGTIAQRWDGASWHVVPVATPPAGSSGMGDVWCASSTDCLAIGANFAEHYNGSAFSLTSAVPPMGQYESLSGLSCTSTTNCNAVGGGNNVAVGAHWNGAKWSKITGIEPNASVYSQLTSIACVGASNCSAVGTMQTAYGSLPFAEHWNGSTWSVEPVPPIPAGDTTAELTGIRCPSATRCIAVGDATTTAGQVLPLAEIWNGTNWALQNAPMPAGVTQSGLHGVACPSTTMCVAVGSADSHTLIERWNGSVWSIQTGAAIPGVSSGLSGITCRTTTECFATGSYMNGAPSYNGVSLIERWNGSTWALQNAPDPKPHRGAGLNAVTCTSATNCFAVGAAHPLGRGGSGILIERWNGTSWSIQNAPTPGSVSDSLVSVACASASDCNAVGTTTDNLDASGILEHWNGSAWTLGTAPLPSDADIISLSGVAVGGGKYTAVGSAESLEGGFGQETYVARSN